MTIYYHHLDWPNRDEYTKYFRDEFIPKHIPDFSQQQKSPWGDNKLEEYWIFFPNQIQDAKIFELQDFLKRNFDFPDISYIIILRPTKDLPIHTDGPDNGTSGVHHTSLNLQISGYEGNVVKFYKKVVDATGYIQGSSYLRAWNNHEVELVDQFSCTNIWTLLNTGVPHSVTASTSGIPKICLSVRFKGFPAFEDSLAKIQGRTTLI
jgi:hypothetical protein